MSASTDFTNPFGIKGGNLFEYWVSFWPVAPYFGVEWRFAPFFAPVAPVAEATERRIDKALSTAGNRLDKAMKSGAEALAVSDNPAGAVAEAATRQTAAAVDDAAELVLDAELDSGSLARPEGLMDKAPAKVDDLKMIKGIGPKLEKELNALGVYTFRQMAGFAKADLAWIDDNLTAFKGRCFRDDWAAQAKKLLG